MSPAIGETVVGDTAFGPVAIVGAAADTIEVGDHIVGGPWPVVGVPGRGLEYAVFRVDEIRPHRLHGEELLWIATSPVTWDFRRDWIRKPDGARNRHPDEPVTRIAATMYDNDGGRELHHTGQLRFGALLVFLLRDAANHVWPEQHHHRLVHDVLEYAIQTDLLRDVTGDEVTDDGFELLELLDPLYPACDWWLGDPERAVGL